MNEDLISVIVPVYKVEKYLRKCVDSILAQTYTNLEIILVDDGSPDECPEICDEYAQKDSRIKVIHQSNGGLSAARNAGIDIASGNYIGFVDSDDYIHPRMYEKLFSAIKDNGSDMVVCKYTMVSENGDVINCDIPISNEKISGLQALKKLEMPSGICFVIVCNKLFSSKLFLNVRFPLGKLCEDNFIIHELYYQCDNVSFITDNLYYYLQRGNSILHSSYDIKMADIVEGFYSRICFLEQNDIDTDINTHYHQLIWVYRDFKMKFRLLNTDDELRIKEIDDIALDIYDKLGKENCNWKEKLFFECLPLYKLLALIKDLFRNN